MVKTRKLWVIGITILVLALLVISLGISLFTSYDFVSSLRIIFGSIFVLFLPGFIISYIFFPNTSSEDNSKFKNERDEKEKSRSIDWIERIALSFALSIAIVPLAVFYLNLIGVRITVLNSFLTILGILVIAGIILYIKNKRKK